MSININTFSVVNGELEIRSFSTGNLLWKGRPNDLDVQIVLPIPKTEDYIVILDWRKAGIQYNKKNLLRLTPFGDILWEVESPSKIEQYGIVRPDLEIYTGIISLKNNKIEAYCFSGFTDEIDLDSGKITKSVFVK
jgi:hypothetical protein